MIKRAEPPGAHPAAAGDRPSTVPGHHASAV